MCVLLASCSAVPLRPLTIAGANTPAPVTAPHSTDPATAAPENAHATQSTLPAESPVAAAAETARHPLPPFSAIELPRAVPGRLVLIGDSITQQLCGEFLDAECYAFPGAWVADIRGANLVDGFVTEAHLGQADTVVISSIGGWHSPGVDDSEILARLQALYQRLTATVRRLIVLVPPYPNFVLCTAPSTPEAIALLGDRHDELCRTQQLIAGLERTWAVTEIPIVGPYAPDQEHQTPPARSALAGAIRFVLSSGADVIVG